MTPANNRLGIILMLGCAICLCFANLVWKLMPGLDLIYLFGGYAIYAVSALLMILAYRYGELSVLHPLMSVSYIFSIIISIFILQEDVTAINIFGVVLVASGAILIGRGSR